MEFDTLLTPAETERLAMLAEEAAEVVQCCTKILRHGYNSYHPDNPSVSNRQLLKDEVVELFAIAERMMLHGDFQRIDFFHSNLVWERKLKYTHHQK